MMLSVNRTAYPVTALGPGRRLGLWVQGCSLHCEGCVSADTWDEDLGTYVDATELALTVSELIADEHLDGLTITGGEPLQQPEALAEFLAAFRGRCGREVGVLVFTGYEEGDVRDHFGRITSLVDALVCGPYNASLVQDDGLIASANQTVYATTQLGEDSLVDYISSAQRQLQVHVGESEIVFAGIPKAGDLLKIEEGLLARGIEIGGRSWAI